MNLLNFKNYIVTIAFSLIISATLFPYSENLLSAEENTRTPAMKYNITQTIEAKKGADLKFDSGTNIIVSPGLKDEDGLIISQLFNYEGLDTDESYIFKLDSANPIDLMTVEVTFDTVSPDENFDVFCVDRSSGAYKELSFTTKNDSGEVLISASIGAMSNNADSVFGSAADKNFNGDIIIFGHALNFKKIDSLKQTVAESGGVLKFKSGSGVEIPPGSINETAEVMIGEFDINKFDNAPAQKIFTIQSSSMIKNAILTVKLPEKYWKKYISAVYMAPDGDTVFIDPVFNDAAKTMAIKLEGGKRPVADMKRKPRGKGGQSGPTAGGSENKGVDLETGACVIIETGGEPLEVPASRLIELPYYEQGGSGCCWAASTLMFMKSYMNDPYSDTSIYEILKGMKLGKNDGIGGAWSSDMTRLGARIKGYTGKKTETVTFYNFNNFIKYVISQTACGKPVMANMGLHQGLFLGYEITGDGKKMMIYHDPQNSNERTPAQTPYRKVSDAQIKADFTPAFAKSINITICAKDPVNEQKVFLQTFHMPDSQDGNILMKSSGGVGTIKKSGKRRLVADYITWDAFSENGYKFNAWQEQPEFDEFIISAMPVWNSDRKNDAKCSIRSSIHRIRGGVIEYPALLETAEVNITLKKCEDVSVPGPTGDHPSRYLYSNAFEMNALKKKLDSNDLEFAAVNELRDAKNNLIGLFNIKFKYRPLIITPGSASGAVPGGTIQFKAAIGEKPADCEWSVSDNNNASIDASGLFKLSESAKPDIASKISVGAVEKNDNAPELNIGDRIIKLLKCATAEIGISPPAQIKTLVIKPEYSVIGKDDKISFRAFADNEETTEVSWKLTRTPGLSLTVGGHTTLESYDEEAVEKSDILGEISKDGVYTPPVSAPEYSVQIIAAAKASPSKKAKAKVSVSSVKITEESDPVELEESQKYKVTAAAFYPPENHGFNYDFGDGSPAVNSERDDCEHKYEKSGNYILKVELLNADKKVVAQDSRKITVSVNKIKVFKEYYEIYTGEQLIKNEFEGYEKDDKIHKHGKFKSYSQGGWVTSEGVYREDKKEGKWRFSNGDKSYSEVFFANDKKEGKWAKYFPSGAKEDEHTYAGDICEGPYTKWFEDGKISETCTFRNGKQEGLYTSLYNDGKKEREGSYKDGEQDGVWTFWRKDGSVSERSRYEKGERKEILNRY